MEEGRQGEKEERKDEGKGGREKGGRREGEGKEGREGWEGEGTEGREKGRTGGKGGREKGLKGGRRGSRAEKVVTRDGIPLIRKKKAPVSLATARAIRVFPVPGGP